MPSALKNSLKTPIVIASGAATALVTALLCALIYNKLGIELYSFSILAMLPVGAFITGMIAGSGFYFSSATLNQRPKAGTFLSMILIAAAAQFIIYYTQYHMLVLSDGTPASNAVSFTDYINIFLTKSRSLFGVQITVKGRDDGFSYIIGVVQFLLFIGGASTWFFMLWKKAECKRCDINFNVIATKTKIFKNIEVFGSYYHTLAQHAVGSPAFQVMIDSPYDKKQVKGSIRLEEELGECPNCRQQILLNKVSVFSGREWKRTKQLNRSIPVPHKVRLNRKFQPIQSPQVRQPVSEPAVNQP